MDINFIEIYKHKYMYRSGVHPTKAEGESFHVLPPGSNPKSYDYTPSFKMQMPYFWHHPKPQA